MISFKNLNITLLLLVSSTLLISCGGKFPGADARKYDKDPAKRVAKNLEDGKGFRFKDVSKSGGGVFEFASSNELWRASLDVIDFMPLTSVNYSGGIIITDGYSNEEKQNESIKITIRFLTNEIRSDSLSIKVFTRKCEESLMNCKYLESNNVLVTELKKEILKKATIYKKEKETKKE